MMKIMMMKPWWRMMTVSLNSEIRFSKKICKDDDEDDDDDVEKDEL